MGTNTELKTKPVTELTHKWSISHNGTIHTQSKNSVDAKAPVFVSQESFTVSSQRTLMQSINTIPFGETKI